MFLRVSKYPCLMRCMQHWAVHGRAKSTVITTARARVIARASLRLCRVSTVIEFRPLFAVSHTVPYTSDLNLFLSY